jgi:hypothetical protein
MKRYLLLATILAATPAMAQAQIAPLSPPVVGANGACSQLDENNLQSHNCYRNRDGYSVHSPSATHNGAPPLGATTMCSDGTWSFSQHRSGTCSHHGGIANQREIGIIGVCVSPIPTVTR